MTVNVPGTAHAKAKLRARKKLLSLLNRQELEGLYQNFNAHTRTIQELTEPLLTADPDYFDDIEEAINEKVKELLRQAKY